MSFATRVLTNDGMIKQNNMHKWEGNYDKKNDVVRETKIFISRA